MMTNKEMNQAIKKELKEAGYKTRDFRVSVRDSTYDTAIKIYIKNAYISKNKIEKLLHHWEEIDRDERTYEILAGCNTYLYVGYESGVVEEAAAGLVEISEKVLADPKYDGRKIADNGEKHVNINKDEDCNCWFLWEFDNKTKSCGYKPNYRVFNASDLAVAMFKFKNLGTIYA